MTTPALLQLHESAHMGAFFEPQFCGKMNDDGTLSLNLTVNAEGKPEDCESTGRISVYAIHISVPAAAFTYEIDGTSSRTSIR